MDKRVEIGTSVGFDALAEDFAGACAIARSLGLADPSAKVAIEALVPLNVADELGRQLFVMPEAACGHGGGFAMIAAQNLEMVGSQSIEIGSATCRARLHARRGQGPCAVLGRALSDSGHSWLIMFVAP